MRHLLWITLLLTTACATHRPIQCRYVLVTGTKVTSAAKWHSGMDACMVRFHLFGLMQASDPTYGWGIQVRRAKPGEQEQLEEIYKQVEGRYRELHERPPAGELY